MSKAAQSTESEIATAVLRYLSTRPDGTATIQTLVKNVPKYMYLTPADQQQSVTRPNEEMWQQKVRNITSHSKSPGNFVYEGYLERLPRKLKITAKGRAYIASKP